MPELPPLALAGDLAAAEDDLAGVAGPLAAWQRGWVLTALGRFGAALEALAACAEADDDVAAAAGVTRGSLYRQLGLHARAEEEDLAALARSATPETIAAAQISLVADAVGGTVDGPTLHLRLQAARDGVRQGEWPRQRIRLGWVTGEVSLLLGAPAPATIALWDSVERSERLEARWHQARSLALLIPALAAVGERDTALASGRRALLLAERAGAGPVQWATHLALAELEDPGEHHAAAARLMAATFATLPDDLAAQARDRPPASWLLAGR